MVPLLRSPEVLLSKKLSENSRAFITKWQSLLLRTFERCHVQQNVLFNHLNVIIERDNCKMFLFLEFLSWNQSRKILTGHFFPYEELAGQKDVHVCTYFVILRRYITIKITLYRFYVCCFSQTQLVLKI